MKQDGKISSAVIRRLPRYLRALEDLENSDTEFEGDEYEWEDGDDLTYATLYDGNYLYAFYISDAYGDYYMTDYVDITLDEEGYIEFSDDGYAYDGDYDDYDDCGDYEDDEDYYWS